MNQKGLTFLEKIPGHYSCDVFTVRPRFRELWPDFSSRFALEIYFYNIHEIARAVLWLFIFTPQKGFYLSLTGEKKNKEIMHTEKRPLIKYSKEDARNLWNEDERLAPPPQCNNKKRIDNPDCCAWSRSGRLCRLTANYSLCLTDAQLCIAASSFFFRDRLLFGDTGDRSLGRYIVL